MKKFYAILCLAIASLTQLQAQAPQGFNYQATVRNSAGDLIVNTNVYFKFNVMQGSQTALPIFTETHYVPTDDLGQVNLVIGEGTASTGTFSELDWSLGSYYLGIELDTDTGNGYLAMGTTQLLSVPYALYAENSGNATATTPSLETVLAQNNSANNQQIKGLQDPTEAQDAVTKAYAETQFYSQIEVDALIANLQSQIDDLDTDNSSGSITDQDGNTYDYLPYGDQVWTVENAEMVTYRDGTPIPEVTDNTEWESLTTGAWAYYDNDPTKPRLYNWYAVMGIHDNDPNTPNKEFAPEGWHVPTDGEWITLEGYLIANGYNYDVTTTGNKIAKAMASTTGWNSSTEPGTVGNDQSLNNSSSFNAFPEGYRSGITSNFQGYGSLAIFWTSTENMSEATTAWRRNLDWNGTALITGGHWMRSGISVRFVSDGEVNSNACTYTIPSNAITGSADIGGSGSNVRWLCDGETVSGQGGGSNTYFMESGSVVNSSGGGSHIIYVKNGATLNISGGGGSITVFYEPNAIINNNLSTGSNVFTLCDAMTFDYSEAPSNPCVDNSNAQVNPVSNIVVCHGSDVPQVDFSTTNNQGTTQYYWTNDNGSIGIPISGVNDFGGLGVSNTTTVPQVSNITVTPELTFQGQTTTGPPETFTVTVNPSGQVDSIADITVNNGESVQPINFTTSNTSGYTTYSWTNSTPSLGLGSSGSGNILAFTAVNNTTTPIVGTITVTPTFNDDGLSCVGPSMSFTITVNPAAGSVTDQDGNTYDYLTYGDEVWTVENAEMVTYRDGTEIPQVTDNTEWQNITTGAWAYYDNDPTKPRLYNWYAVMGIHDAASLPDATLRKEFAPEGWHVPSDAEWITLEEHLIANGYNYDSTTTGNKIAKAMASTTGWISLTNAGLPGNDQSLNNSSGFNALPEGNRLNNGLFYYEGSSAVFWSSTGTNTNSSWTRLLYNYDSSLSSDNRTKRDGFSVRFVRD